MYDSSYQHDHERLIHSNSIRDVTVERLVGTLQYILFRNSAEVGGTYIESDPYGLRHVLLYTLHHETFRFSLQRCPSYVAAVCRLLRAHFRKRVCLIDEFMDTVEVLHNFLFFVGNNRDVLYTLLILIGEQLPEYEMFPLFLNFPALIYLGMEYRDDKKIQMALALSLKKLFERFDNADEQQIQTDLISSPHWREWLRYIDNNRWRWQKCYDIVTQLMTTVSVFLAERELPKLCWTDGNMMILVDDGEAVDILRGE